MLHEFNVDFIPANEVRGPVAFPSGLQQQSHLATPQPSILPQDKPGRTDLLKKPLQAIEPEDIEDFLIPGFRALDEGMKMFWSGIRVPTKDAYRFLRIKIAGADKSVLIWRDDLLNGRARLPVGSLSRTKEDFNKDKFSPAYLPMSIRYATQRGNLVVLSYRPTPWLVEYSLSVWSEHKRDAEYIKYQMLNRFNPLAEFWMSDGHIQGVLTIRFGGAQDQSDKEASFEQHRLIKYVYTMTAEAWLPLPERVIPSVLGQILVVNDATGGPLLYGVGNFGTLGSL